MGEPTSASVVSVTELLQLTHLGIPLENITWPRVILSSDQWLCVRHNKPSTTTMQKYCMVTILNPHQADLPQRWQTRATAIKMCPTKPWAAIKVGYVLQVHDLESRKQLHTMQCTGPIMYWNWITSDIIVVITESSVFHWNLGQGNSSQTMFLLHPTISVSEIVSYTGDVSLKWLAVTGLVVQNRRICGFTQLYSVDQDLSQTIEVHAVSLCRYQFQGNQHPSTLLVAASRSEGNTGKVHVVELGPSVKGNQCPASFSEVITFEDQWSKYDFPVSIEVSTKLGVFYVMSKQGWLYVCDLETAIPVRIIAVSNDIVFATTLNTETQGITAISRNGQVLSIELKPEHLVRYLHHTLKKHTLAERLSRAFGRLLSATQL